MPSKAKITLGMPSREKVRQIHAKARARKKKPAAMVIEYFDSLPDKPNASV